MASTTCCCVYISRFVINSLDKAKSSIANDMMNNTTAYEFNEKRKQYGHPQYASWLCLTVEQTNRSLLEEEKLSRDYSFDHHTVSKTSNLSDLLKIGAADAYVSDEIFCTFMEEMQQMER